MAKTSQSGGSKQRRAYEYDHEYGVSLTGPKKPPRSGARRAATPPKSETKAKKR